MDFCQELFSIFLIFSVLHKFFALSAASGCVGHSREVRCGMPKLRQLDLFYDIPLMLFPQKRQKSCILTGIPL